MNNRTAKVAACAVALSLMAAACAGDSGTAMPAEATESETRDIASQTEIPDDAGGDDAPAETETDAVTISYWLWDHRQQPLYEKCATNFSASTPRITVEFTQFGLGDYWDAIQAGFATGDVPDVFTNDVTKYPEFLESDLLLPLDDAIEARGVPTDIYWDGLAELWVAPNGERYGLPKDFDTVALVVNQNLLEGSGLVLDDLSNLDWNPDDGGSFEAVIAALSVDTNGVRGNEDGFDARRIAQYGYVSNAAYADAFSQTGWSAFAGGTGWEFLDINPWGNEYFYDDERFISTIEWWATLVEKGFMPDSKLLTTSGADTIFADGTAATMTDGSWKIATWTTTDGVDGAFVPTPIGPTGSRASMYSGLADSITTASAHPDEAFEWVEYMASAECQDIVGAGAVDFPAIPSASAIAQQAHAANGIDVSAFTVHLGDDTTFAAPITIEGSEVRRIIGHAIDAVMRGEGDAQTIIDANAEINGLIAG